MPSDCPPTPVLIGGYTLVDEIGSGTSGRVFRASRPDNADVAIKLIPARKVSLAVRREVDIHSRIDHPNVVRLIDVVQAPAVARGAEPPLALVMELCTRGDLFEEVQRRGPLHPSAVRRRVRDVALALRHLHEKKLVHGDVKCENIALAADGTAKLLDFGCARDATVPSTTSPTSFGGTTQYLAPELVVRPDNPRPAPPTAAADAWALGVVAYVAAGCAYPFCATAADDSDADRATRENIVSSQPEPLPSAADIPSDIQTVIDGLLTKDPAVRMSVSDVLAALDEPPRILRRRYVPRFPPRPSPGASPRARPTRGARAPARSVSPASASDSSSSGSDTATETTKQNQRRSSEELLQLVDRTRRLYTESLLRSIRFAAPATHPPCDTHLAATKAGCC